MHLFFVAPSQNTRAPPHTPNRSYYLRSPVHLPSPLLTTAYIASIFCTRPYPFPFVSIRLNPLRGRPPLPVSLEMKRKTEITDRYDQSMGSGKLHSPPVEKKAGGTDIFTAGRLARGIAGMRPAIRQGPNLHFGLPSLLHCDPEQYPQDRNKFVRAV